MREYEVKLRPRHPIDKSWPPEVWALLSILSKRTDQGGIHGDMQIIPLTFDQAVNLTMDFRGITLSPDEIKRAWVLMDEWVKTQEKELP